MANQEQIRNQIQEPIQMRTQVRIRDHLANIWRLNVSVSTCTLTNISITNKLLVAKTGLFLAVLHHFHPKFS